MKMFQNKVELPKSQYGKDIRSVHDEKIGGYRKYGRHRIHGKKNVGNTR